MNLLFRFGCCAINNMSLLWIAAVMFHVPVLFFGNKDLTFGFLKKESAISIKVKNYK